MRRFLADCKKFAQRILFGAFNTIMKLMKKLNKVRERQGERMNDQAETAIFLSRNWLACSMAAMAFAVSEICALSGFLPVVLPPGNVLAIEAIALLAIASSRYLPNWRQRLVSSLLCAMALALLAKTFAVLGKSGLWRGFPAIFLCGLCFWIVSQRVSKWGRAYQLICSCLTSIACLFVGAIIAWSLLDTAVSYLPQVYDPVLYRIDVILKLNTTYRLADLLAAYPRLNHLVLILYKYNLIFAVPEIFSEAFYTRKKMAALPLELLISSFQVFPFFCMVPALAPAFFFGSEFPSHLPAAFNLPLHNVAAPVQSIRNTFPSLHACWAILCVFALRDSPFWHRLIAILYLCSIFVATLGFGAHCAVDWLGAMALVLATRALASLPCRAGIWLPPLSCGILLLLAWVFVIRQAGIFLAWQPAIWFLAGLSLLLPLWFEARLAAAERCG